MDLDDRITRPIPDHPARTGCLVEGCPCKDPLILSHRRARFYAHLAALFDQYCHAFVAADTVPLDALSSFLDEVFVEARLE